jgi:antitoxin YefM
MTETYLTIPANQARTNFYKILNEVNDKLCQVSITLRGKAKAVIISAEEFASWQETLEIMADKKLMESIKEGLVDMKKGKTIPAEKVKKMIGL